MDILTGLLNGFAAALSPTYLLMAIAGVLLGQIVGALPGIGPSAAIALLLVFGSVVAAGVPLAVGGAAVLVALAAIFVIASLTPMSIFVLNLATLLELKIASGMTAAHRLQDLADVIQLIRVNALPQTYSVQLNPFVRTKFDELWHAAQVSEDY